jgi:hypothetical protein
LSPPIRIALEFFGTAEHRPPPALVAQKDPGQPIGDFARNLEQVHQVAGTRGALDFEVVTVIAKIVHQGANDQRVDRHPQIGPRQLELPPNMPLSDSAGK